MIFLICYAFLNVDFGYFINKKYEYIDVVGIIATIVFLFLILRSFYFLFFKSDRIIEKDSSKAIVKVIKNKKNNTIPENELKNKKEIQELTETKEEQKVKELQKWREQNNRQKEEYIKKIISEHTIKIKRKEESRLKKIQTKNEKIKLSRLKKEEEDKIKDLQNKNTQNLKDESLKEENKQDNKLSWFEQQEIKLKLRQLEKEKYSKNLDRLKSLTKNRNQVTVEVEKTELEQKEKGKIDLKLDKKVVKNSIPKPNNKTKKSVSKKITAKKLEQVKPIIENKSEEITKIEEKAMSKERALNMLRRSINMPNATFREGQWEAIEKLTINKEKLLVIQRTGWGKSSVYFISSKILREQGRGPTIIISPLLALMRNQIEAAERLGIKAVTINSTNFDDWKAIQNEVLNGNIDTLLISPERLANDRFMDEILLPIANKIGLFVVDEAHCISDWGHDFRPDYRRIVGILKAMPSGMPILATTATANDRVVNDIEEQLGGIKTIRGGLTRASLKLQNIKLQDQASRLAWLKENIPNMDGSGIIYVLTKRDARAVTQWLNECNIDAAAYYSDVKHENFADSTTYREFLEDSLYNNDIKVLVASTALGMGYDKPDLNFVIHFQAPESIIGYYQQVGRAGRAIDSAYGILLSGQEDADVHRYFREGAFPTEETVEKILEAIEDHEGLTIPRLQELLNVKYSQITKTIKYLSVEEPSPIVKIGTKWQRTAINYSMDTDKIQRLTNQRLLEWEIVQNYIQSKECLMLFLQSELDDDNVQPCGQCANCLNKNILSNTASQKNVLEASVYLKHSEFDIEPRKQIAGNALTEYEWRGNLPKNLQAEKGKVLSRWGDAGWGKMVADDKHHDHFRDELVDAMYDMIIKRWRPNPFPEWITCIPSLRAPQLVPNFAERLAAKLGIPFIPIIIKVKDSNPQKEQENSYHQCKNLDGVFQINGDVQNKPVFLFDDAVDSRWTFTIAATLLRKAGSGIVIPIALTSTSVSE